MVQPTAPRLRFISLAGTDRVPHVPSTVPGTHDGEVSKAGRNGPALVEGTVSGEYRLEENINANKCEVAAIRAIKHRCTVP